MVADGETSAEQADKLMAVSWRDDDGKQMGQQCAVAGDTREASTKGKRNRDREEARG